MADYRANTAEAQTWRRAFSVILRNPLTELGERSISFEEQDVVRVGAQVMTTTVGGPEGLRCHFDPAATFDLLDPATGAVTGQASHLDVYAALYSLYMSLAKARDLKAAAPAPAPGPAPINPQ